MIEVKAETVVQDGEKGTNLTTRMEGTGEELINEILSTIEGLMKGLKDEDDTLHLVALQTLADNPWILSGESQDEYEAMRRVAESKGILKGGLN